jgi:hypothetical protein
VSQEYHKFLAQETVSGLAGVKTVNNQLMVIGDQPSELMGFRRYSWGRPIWAAP